VNDFEPPCPCFLTIWQTALLPRPSMIDAHIHRVILVDEERRPVGIMSSMDCMAAMVRSHHSLASERGTAG
jgi:CBS-domain-containing membrane protein